jgi:flagellar motor switch protein FliG
MLLTSLESRNPKLVQAIQQKMFIFDDLSDVDPIALQRVMRGVDLRDLAIALKSGSPKVKAALLGCISKRAAATVNEEISFMGSMKQREIEAAQAKILELVRRLETEGEIELAEARTKQNASTP